MPTIRTSRGRDNGQSKATAAFLLDLTRGIGHFSAMIKRIFLASLSLGLGLMAYGAASADCTRDAMLVFDGSGSMSEMGFNELDEPRIFEARRALNSALPDIAEIRRIGLLIYGPGPEGQCHNIDLRFSPIANAAPRILAEVEALQPAGNTPLTEAVRKAAETLSYKNRPGVVVLVTDGKETCSGQPCELAASLAADGYDLTVHVIGFKVRGEFFNWDSSGEEYRTGRTVARCLADRTGGQYHHTETVDELAEALRQTLGCPFSVGLPTIPRG